MAKGTSIAKAYKGNDEAAPQTGEVVQQIPVSQIVPCPTNPRGEDLGDISGIAASIRSVGVEQPLILQPADTAGIHVIAFGHRRFAGAKEAGLETVPAIVRAYTPEKLLKAQIIENFARADLDELAEAKAFQRLVKEFRYSQRKVAEEIGCTQAQVSRRIALLKLDKAALDALSERKITIHEAVDLTKLAEMPAAQRKKAVKEFLGSGGHNRRWVLERHLRTEKDRKTKEELIDKLEGEGISYIAKVEQYDTNERYLGQEGWGQGCGITVEEHENEPCHAATISDHSHRRLYVCLDITRHAPEGDSAVKLPDVELERRAAQEARSQREAAEEAFEETLLEARRERALYLQSLLGERPSAAEALERVLVHILDQGGFGSHQTSSHVHVACMMLGLKPREFEKDELPSYYSGDGKDWMGTFRQYLSDGGSHVPARAALALALAANEAGFTSKWDRDRRMGQLVEYLGYLERKGYKLSDAEKQLVAQPAAVEVQENVEALADAGEEVAQDDELVDSVPVAVTAAS